MCRNSHLRKASTSIQLSTRRFSQTPVYTLVCDEPVNPIPASSGNTVRHRLNRGGDRRLNRALHIAVLTRMTHDPQTRAYVERRQVQGRTTKEIRRCLKRYLARQIHRILNTTNAVTRPA